MKRVLFLELLLVLLFIIGCSKTDNTSQNTTSSIDELKSSSDTNEQVQIEYPLDFSIKTKNKTLKVLQLTDPQVFMTSEEELNDRAYQYMDYVVGETNPDLILLTGDIIYGKYDSDGSIFTSIVNHMDSYNIPWAPVFGNHDNESKVGTDYQVNKFLNASNCLFVRRSELTGNGNYSIGLFIDDKLVRTIYMIDTKGCSMVDGIDNNNSLYGIDESQVKFIVDSQEKAKAYNNGVAVKGFVGLHVMPSMMTTAVYIKYQTKVNDLKTIKSFVIPENDDGDFGSFHENTNLVIDKNGDAFYSFVDSYIDGIFAGHEHQNNASVIFEGIRMTYGLKSSTCDFYRSDKLGGTLIEVNSDSFDVTHIYYNFS